MRCSCFEIGEVGIGYSDGLGKINHSCDPNVIGEFSGNSVSLFALKDVNPGEQVTMTHTISLFFYI